MAQIVSIIGITHNPFMPRLFKQAQQPPGAVKVKERIAMMREKLAAAKVDVLVCIGNDHLHQFFMDNMPAFMIGKMEQYDGTFYDEEREFGLPKCKLQGDLDVSDAIMEGAFDRGVDFSYSNELTIDHSIVVPMMFVRPEMDIPIVPILTNCIAPPMPRAKRYFEVGKAIRAAIDSLPTNKRIGVLVSGHLSLEIGGPKMFEPRLTDPNFDANAVGWIVNGNIDAATEACAPEKMLQYGNMTTGYLNFIMMMGVANLAKPSYAEGLDAGFPAIPFFSWDQSPKV
ncbi:MAG TPA: extradiol ring-cleavage dioxygenase [Candidatus Limnocylindria bacterium]|nr:extradiol ring-cleavage dioxygenase [Candidatus Limnocylindria bacterium]